MKAFHFLLWPLLLYIGVAYFSLSKPLTLDEANPIAINADAIIHDGWKALSQPDPSNPNQNRYEISHPILYDYVLALHFRLFGGDTVAARLIGVSFFFITLLLIFVLSQQLFPGRTGQLIGVFATLLYAMNPFIVQHSLLLTSDTSLLPVTLLIFVCVFLHFGSRPSWKSTVSLSLSFAFCLWAKEVTPFFLLIGMFLYVWHSQNFKSALIVTSKVGLFGVLLFGLTWILYCNATGLPPLIFVKFSLLDKALSPEFNQEHRSLNAMIYKFSFVIRWLTPAFFCLLIMALLRRVTLLWRFPKKGAPTDFLWIFLILFGAITNFHMYANPRYQFPIYGMGVILIGEFLFHSHSKSNRQNWFMILPLGIIVGILLALIPYEPLHELILLRQTSQFTGQFEPHLAYILMRIGLDVFIFSLLPLGTFFIFQKVMRISFSHASRWIPALVSVFIATSVSLNIKQTQPFTTAISWSIQSYGERGFWDTLEFLKKNIGNSVPVIRKDLAYYLFRKTTNSDLNDGPDTKRDWIDNGLFRTDFPSPHQEKVVSSLLNPKIKYIVLDIWSNPYQVRTLISGHFDLVKIYGNFKIFQKKPSYAQ
ncbi:hypothetical protein BVX98_01420 [bacterium F11]|nr:hypothetical protein BVX98_01420 [bacterium F11]